MKSRYSCLIIMIVAVATVMSSCRSSRQKGESQPSMQGMTLQERFDALTSDYSAWKDVSLPVKVEITAPKRFSISGRATMVRGESILISLRVFGMEVGNLYVTEDSVFATEKIHKYYVAESLERFLGGFPLTINDIQDLLLGQAFVLGNGTMSREDYRKTELATGSGLWTITPQKTSHGIGYTFCVDDGSNTVSSLIVSKDGNVVPVSCRYSYPVADTGAGTVAGTTTLAGEIGSHGINASLKWSMQDAKWNTGDTRRWDAPENYKRIPVASLVKVIESI
ncbi:MAG: DUF4292 domain-containing protein [Muribaculaceae bacterium]|nr:DUF4292 domain-containing protein [Muribaculaceae bacterium]